MICLQGWLEICISTSDDIRGYHLHSPHPLFADLKKKSIPFGYPGRTDDQISAPVPSPPLHQLIMPKSFYQSIAAKCRRRRTTENEGGGGWRKSEETCTIDNRKQNQYYVRRISSGGWFSLRTRCPMFSNSHWLEFTSRRGSAVRPPDDRRT